MKKPRNKYKIVNKGNYSFKMGKKSIVNGKVMRPILDMSFRTAKTKQLGGIKFF